MITREQIAQLLKSISEAHYQIHSYGWGDVPDLLAREDVIYPFLMVTPSSSNYEEGYATHTYTISIADRVLKDKANEVNVDSDTHQILLDILSQIDNLMYDDVDVVKGGTITPFFDNFRHEVTGHFADVGIRVKFAYDSCAVPSDIVPLPLPPPFECADATYRVQYENGTLIEEGTIVSGGSKTINVPNPSICDPASYEVRDADGNILYSGTISSGGSENIVVTNSTVVVRKSDNTIISSVSVLAQGSANYQVADSVVTLTDTDAATLSTTNIKATDPATIVAPNGTINVNKSDGVLISGQVVKSGETKGYNVADSVVSNSDASYTANVKATDPLPLPDQQINVNSVDEGDIPSVGTIDINLTDGVNPVVPNSVIITGRTVDIEVPSGGGSFNVGSVDRFGNTLPTIIVSSDTTLNWNSYDFADDYLSKLLNPPTGAQLAAVYTFFDDMITAGIFQKASSIPLIIGGSADDHKWNARYPYDKRNANLLEFFGSPTHSASGIVTDGSTNSCYITSAAGVLDFQNKQISCYVRVANDGAATNSVSFGAGTGNSGIKFLPRPAGSDPQFTAEGSLAAFGIPKNGFLSIQSNSTSARFHRNGALLGTSTNGTIDIVGSCGFGSQAIGLDRPCPLSFSYAYIGEALSDAEELDHYNIVQALQVALSRNI